MFFEFVFCLLENEFFVPVFSLLYNFKTLISFLNSVFSFSYFSFFISFFCDGFRNGENINIRICGSVSFLVLQYFFKSFNR